MLGMIKMSFHYGYANCFRGGCENVWASLFHVLYVGSVDGLTNGTDVNIRKLIYSRNVRFDSRIYSHLTGRVKNDWELAPVLLWRRTRLMFGKMNFLGISRDILLRSIHLYLSEEQLYISSNQ